MQIRACTGATSLCSMKTDRFVPPLLLLTALAAGAEVRAQSSGFESLEGTLWPAERGVSIHLDNDLFTGTHRDHDYSWGIAATFAAPEPGRIVRPIERLRARLDAWLPGDHPTASHRSRTTQVGLLGMTPKDLESAAPLSADRPYASLLFVTSAQTVVFANSGRARFTSLTVGALGLGAAETLQKSVHGVLGGDVPNGWDHQVSAGGEPTARFVRAEQWLLGGFESLGGGRPQVKLTLAGSVGYLTEASTAVSMRFGRIHSPWWSFNPELADYSPAPVAPVPALDLDGARELYGFLGARVKARAYNALLQGQFRHSDVRIGSDELARTQLEAWAGLTSSRSDWRITYAVHVATKEATPAPAARTLAWASLSVERAF